MAITTVVIFLLMVSISASLGENATKKDAPSRQSRNFDNFGEYAGYYNQNEADEIPEPPVYTDAGANPGPDTRPERKYYEQPKEKVSAPPVRPLYYPAANKGYPYYGKGGAVDAFFPVNQQQVTDMMKLMNEIEKESTGGPLGFIGKLFSDPKTILLIALIPISIMLASFIPLLVNSFMTGVSLPSIMPTVASSGTGRGFNSGSNLQMLLQSLDKYGRKLDDFDCVEESICHIITDSSDGEGAAYIKRAVKAAAKILKSEWVGHPRISRVLSAIKSNNCSHVCEKSKLKRKKENFLM